MKEYKTEVYCDYLKWALEVQVSRQCNCGFALIWWWSHRHVVLGWRWLVPESRWPGPSQVITVSDNDTPTVETALVPLNSRFLYSSTYRRHFFVTFYYSIESSII